jgi:hypothetical protein
MDNNYRNRKSRGQCASCTDPALPNQVRCQTCKDYHRDQWSKKSEAYNAIRRKKAIQRSLEREKRLDEINEQLKLEIAALEKQLSAAI